VWAEVKGIGSCPWDVSLKKRIKRVSTEKKGMVQEKKKEETEKRWGNIQNGGKGGGGR